MGSSQAFAFYDAKPCHVLTNLAARLRLKTWAMLKRLRFATPSRFMFQAISLRRHDRFSTFCVFTSQIHVTL